MPARSRTQDAITGGAVQIARQVTTAAQPEEMLATRTAKDVIVGSGIQVTERDTHPLADDDEDWATYAIAET
jgi:hypothetical protein